MKKTYESPEFDLFKFSFDAIMDDDIKFRPSDSHIPKEDGDDWL